MLAAKTFDSQPIGYPVGFLEVNCSLVLEKTLKWNPVSVETFNAFPHFWQTLRHS